MLNLLTPTDPAWVEAASDDLAGLLSDHAHCELKAAHSALALLTKFGCEVPALQRPLSELAREEIEHFQQVCGRISQRGEKLRRTEPDCYAQALWAATKLDRRRETVLLDRLLTSALIEARSCERFQLLSRSLTDPDLAEFYGALMKSEAGHYRLFCRLAEQHYGVVTARDRLAQLAEREREVADRLPFGPKDARMSDSSQGNLRTIGSAVLLAMFIRIALFEAFEIEGPSMEPTLLNGDRVVVAKFSYGLFLPFMKQAVVNWGVPNVGDVVIVKSPRDNVDIVKRVVGLPGDHIELLDGVVWRNGEPVTQSSLGKCEDDGDRSPDPFEGECEWFREKLGDHSYRISRNVDSLRSSRAEITLAPGTIFLLGDHRDRSNDSRQLGAIPIERIKGHVLSIYWSSRGGPAGCMSLSGLRSERMLHSVD